VGDIPETLEELKVLLPDTDPIRSALEWAKWGLAQTTKPEEKVVCVDIEGKSSAVNPLSEVTEIGVGKQSFAMPAMGGAAGPSGDMQPVCDVRGGWP